MKIGLIRVWEGLQICNRSQNRDMIELLMSAISPSTP